MSADAYCMVGPVFTDVSTAGELPQLLRPCATAQHVPHMLCLHCRILAHLLPPALYAMATQTTTSHTFSCTFFHVHLQATPT